MATQRCHEEREDREPRNVHTAGRQPEHGFASNDRQPYTQEKDEQTRKEKIAEALPPE